MRTIIFQKAKYLLSENLVKKTGETDYSISFEVGKYHVVAKYQKHKLIWICNCKSDLNNSLCAHKIASQSYLVYLYNLKVPQIEPIEIPQTKTEIGRVKLTIRQKDVLKEMVENKCQLCRLEKPLEIHRIKRGNKGGKYVPNNVLVICEDCHKELHAEEN